MAVGEGYWRSQLLPERMQASYQIDNHQRNPPKWDAWLYRTDTSHRHLNKREISSSYSLKNEANLLVLLLTSLLNLPNPMLQPRFLYSAIALCCSCILSVYAITSSVGLPSDYRGTLVVTVKCKNNEGRVQAYLYSAPTYWLKTDPNTQRITRANINQGIAIIVFKDIPYGQYALSLLHDLNMNNDMDYNVVGMPTEGWGFSNKRPPVLYKPSWQECSFSIGSPTKTLNVSMTYL